MEQTGGRRVMPSTDVAKAEQQLHPKRTDDAAYKKN
jgi:hypothetical protein